MLGTGERFAPFARAWRHPAPGGHIALDRGLLTIRLVIDMSHSIASAPRAGEGTRAPAHSVGRRASRAWCLDKLAAWHGFLRAPVVEIRDPSRLDAAEHGAVSARLDAANMAVYRVTGSREVNRDALLELGRQFGLVHAERNLCAGEDAVSEITASDDPGRRRYIPYTRRALSWHTDGYYNPPARTIGAFLLHCVHPAASGGANRFIDHEVLFALLSLDAHVPVEALFDDDALAIPANVDGEAELRERAVGPVFDERGGALVMRFSARQRHIQWKQSADVLAAAAAVGRSLENTKLVLDSRLEAGMGVIARNVLHRREAYFDNPAIPRLLYRVRYTDPIVDDVLTATRRDLAS